MTARTSIYKTWKILRWEIILEVNKFHGNEFVLIIFTIINLN